MFAARSRRWIVAGGVLTLIFASCTGGRTAARTVHLSTAHDVFDGDVGDPFVLPVSRGAAGVDYVVFGTNDDPAHVPTGHSPDLTHWTRTGDAVPELPGWAAPDPTNSLTWAPAVVHKGDRYIMYLTVPEKASGRECIAALASPVADGPYEDALAGPLLCQRDLGGSIDPSVVTDASGVPHLLWKNDGNCCGLPVGLWEQDLSGDGLHLTGGAHQLLVADQQWEGGVIEEPAMLPAAQGGWWLFYSGNVWDLAGYGTGLAYCSHIDGPCRKMASGPFIASGEGQASPGGLETFVDDHGQRWVVYATWNRPPRNGRFYCCRSMDLARVLAS